MLADADALAEAAALAEAEGAVLAEADGLAAGAGVLLEHAPRLNSIASMRRTATIFQAFFIFIHSTFKKIYVELYYWCVYISIYFSSLPYETNNNT